MMAKINENEKTKQSESQEKNKCPETKQESKKTNLRARYAGDPREPWEIKRDMIREAKKHSTISPAIG